MKQTEEEFFKILISKSKLELPVPDFEEKVMRHIKKEKVYRQQHLSREITWSWVFVIIIIALGTGFSLLISQLQTFYFGIPSYALKTVFEFMFTVFVLLQIDTLIKYTFRSKETGLRNQLKKLTRDVNSH